MSHIPATLRRAVQERAGGRCEYCLIPEAFTLAAHEVDHIIAQKHGGLTDDANLALSCVLCNQRKGSDISSIDPESGRVEPLFHPRRQRWHDHFEIEGVLFRGRTPTGRVTVRLLQLNRVERLRERVLLLEAGVLPLR